MNIQPIAGTIHITANFYRKSDHTWMTNSTKKKKKKFANILSLFYIYIVGVCVCV